MSPIASLLYSLCRLLCGDVSARVEDVGQRAAVNEEPSLLSQLQLDVMSGLGENSKSQIIRNHR